MRKLRLVLQPADERPHAAPGVLVGIARVSERPARQLVVKVRFQPLRAVEIQQRVAVSKAQRQQAQALLAQALVDLADLPEQLLFVFIRRTEEAAGLDTGKRGRALAHNKFLRHITRGSRRAFPECRAARKASWCGSAQ